jgi:hypothetical protein
VAQPRKVSGLGNDAERHRPISSQTLRAAVAEIHFTIKRSEHAVNYGLPAWGDDVAFTVAVEGIYKLLTSADG